MDFGQTNVRETKPPLLPPRCPVIEYTEAAGWCRLSLGGGTRCSLHAVVFYSSTPLLYTLCSLLFTLYSPPLLLPGNQTEPCFTATSNVRATLHPACAARIQPCLGTDLSTAALVMSTALSYYQFHLPSTHSVVTVRPSISSGPDIQSFIHSDLTLAEQDLGISRSARPRLLAASSWHRLFSFTDTDELVPSVAPSHDG